MTRAIALIAGQLRHAARSLLRSPGLTITAIVTLALGTGANTATFSIVNVVLLKPLPFADPERLVMVWSTSPDQGLVEGFSSFPDFDDWRQRSTAFDGLAAFWTFPNGDVNLTGGSEPQRVSVARVSAGFFDVLGVAPLYGRTFHPEESIAGNHRRAILSHGLWRGQFGGDPTLIGREVLVNGLPYNVVGIMPPELESRSVRVLGTDVQLWRPLVPDDNQTGGRDSRRLRVVGRLASAVTLQRAEAELAAIARRLAEAYPETNRDTGVRLVPVREQVVRDVKSGLMLLLAAVGVVVIGACANVANLLLIKAAARRKEMAMRHALGASRLRLSAEVLAESVLLAVTGSLLGVWLAFAIVRAVAAAGPADISLLADVRIDGMVLAFTLVATLLTVVLVAVVPAWRVGRPDVPTVFRQGGSRSRGRDDRRLMGVLTVSQIALAMVLLATGGLLARSFQALLRVNPGLDSTRVLTFQLELPMATTYTSQLARNTFFRTLLERLEAVPEIQAATMASAPPLDDEPTEVSFSRPGVADNRLLRANFQLIAPGYFRVLGIPVIAGRSFHESDDRSAPRVAMVSETLARTVWGSDDPVGERIDLPFGGEAEVIGIAGDVRRAGLDGDAGRTLYVPASQLGYNFMTVIVKSRTEPQTSVRVIRQLVRDLDPTLPLYRMHTVDELIAQSVAHQRFQLLLVGSFSLIAFALAVIGTYGVTSYGVSERTSEMGIRVALGATRTDIGRLVLRESLQLASTGIVVGGIVAIALSRVLTRFVFQVSTLDSVAFTAAPLLLASAALLAAYVPARRATRIDPLRVLRAD